MKLRMPTMIFKPESYEELRLFKNLVKEEYVLSLNVTFHPLNVYEHNVVIEDMVLDCDVKQILEAKKAELLKLSEEIEALENEERNN